LQNRYKDSIRETRKVTDNDPDNTNAILLIGDGYYSQTQYDSAMYWYNQAYDLDYRSAALSHVMAFIYDTQGQPQKAIPFYQEAIGMDSSLVDIYRRLGELIPGEEGNWYRTKAAQVYQQ
jgi:tetratricopeptide (TPR) repeat protein